MRGVARLGLLLVALVPGHASGDVFRCVGPEGGVRYVDRRAACPAGELRPVRGRIERHAPVRREPSGARPGPGRAAGARVAPEAVLPPPASLDRSWETVDEAPTEPRRDEDLRRWGVRALRVRHYALRGEPGSSRVCTVEVWAFRDAARARAARRGFARRGWRIEREGPLLVMAHGVSLTLGEPVRGGLFPACGRLADRSRARAARLLEAERAAPAR